MSDTPIYLDYHATTPVDPRVAQLMMQYLTVDFGNPGSVDHIYGDIAEKAVNSSRAHIARLINASAKEIIFTSGATESINLVIQGVVNSYKGSGLPRIAVTTIEHKAVLDTCSAIAKQGSAEIIYIGVNGNGQIDVTEIDRVCKQNPSLVCVMAANNEIGNIYPIEKISAIAQTYNVPFLCDASQAAGKIPLDFQNWGITYLAISGHKIYAPKGIGALAVKKGYSLLPLIFGGGQERGMRSGTLNVPGIVAFGEACRLRLLEMAEDETQIARLRDRLQELWREKIPGLVVNGDINNRLAGNLHISIPGIPNSAIIARIRDRVAISRGAACSSGVEAPSHVLRAMGLPENLIEGSLRIGIGKFTTAREIEDAGKIISDTIKEIGVGSWELGVGS